MNAAQSVGKSGKVLLLEPRRILPFGQRRNAFERELNGLAQDVGVQPFGQRIDRVDQRQRCEAGLVDHPVRMHHLQMAVVKRRDP